MLISINKVLLAEQKKPKYLVFSIQPKNKHHLSHISKIYLKRMSDLGLIPKFNFNFDICESCLSRKMTKKPLANNKDMKIIKYYPL